MNGALHVYGNHRGGTEVMGLLPPAAQDLYDPRWLLADPAQDRSAHLARLVQDRFPRVSPVARRLTAREALREAGEEDTLVLTMDTVGDTAEVIAARRPDQRVLFQLVGRGPGGAGATRIGLGGTLTPGDAGTEDDLFALLSAFGSFSQAASSRALTSDPLTGVALGPMRRSVSARTAVQLLEQERDPWDLSGGPLSVALGGVLHPLAVARAEGAEGYRDRTALALDAAGRIPARAWRREHGSALSVAAVLGGGRIELFRVGATSTGARRVLGMVPFAAEPAAPRLRTPGSGVAVFTD